jgi:hypothetical protein
MFFIPRSEPRDGTRLQGRLRDVGDGKAEAKAEGHVKAHGTAASVAASDCAGKICSTNRIKLSGNGDVEAN